MYVYCTYEKCIDFFFQNKINLKALKIDKDTSEKKRFRTNNGRKRKK